MAGSDGPAIARMVIRRPVVQAAGSADGADQDALQLIGKQAGLTEPDVAACEKDQALLDKLKGRSGIRLRDVRVDATPTFFVKWRKAQGRNVV